MPQRRTILKWVHWSMVPLLVWFVFVTPDDVLPFGPKAFQAHSILALVFVTLSLLWFADYMRRGLASRPGPKLTGRLRKFHHWMHVAIIWGLLLVAVGGFLLGLTASRVLKAGGFLPIAPALNLPDANHWVGQVHIYQFYLLAILTIVHGGFHIWRHYKLRDNALRIMVPRVFHKYL